MKVFISTYPFGTNNSKPLKILEISNIPYTLNPYKRKLKPNETLELARDYEILIAGTEDLTPLVRNSTRLKFISRVGIGLDSVPLELCKEKGIQVSFTPDAVTPAVVELTIGLMLDGLRKISLADREIRNGIWTRPIGKRIGESIIGIVGFGRVGSGVARTLQGFNPKQIFVNDIIDVSEKIKNLKNLGLEIEFASFEEILEKSNILTLHVPLTPLTKNMIHKETISKMQNFPLLINTSRGEVVNEDDLYEALKINQISHACLDVFTEEPYFGKLTQLENVTLTQHIGSCSEDCRLAMETQAAEEVVRFVNQKPLSQKVI